MFKEELKNGAHTIGMRSFHEGKVKYREKTQELGHISPLPRSRPCTITENTASELGSSGSKFDSAIHCQCDLELVI